MMPTWLSVTLLGTTALVGGYWATAITDRRPIIVWAVALSFLVVYAVSWIYASGRFSLNHWETNPVLVLTSGLLLASNSARFFRLQDYWLSALFGPMAFGLLISSVLLFLQYEKSAAVVYLAGFAGSCLVLVAPLVRFRFPEK
jgi:hypothetical protein